MNKKPEGKDFFAGMSPYLVIVAAIVLSYVLFTLVLGADEGVVRVLMLVGVALSGVFLFVKRLSKRDALKAETFILAIIIAGMIMRIGYMLYTPFSVRDYDISTYDGNGHFAYMYRLFSEGALPSSNEYQLYHPPFQHIVQALVVKIFSLFQPNAELTSLFQAAKIVPCFASCAMLWVCRSFCEEVRLSKRAGAIVLSILAFHPAFYMLSSRVNNDALMLLFFMTSVLYTIRWYYRPTMKNILLIALCIGLSMMTKLSGCLAALFTAPVFIAVLIKKWRESI
jgi:Dolichyl-phosphate-mannose-protein mannosyltransferase.